MSALSMKQGGRIREHPNTLVINQPTDNCEVGGRGCGYVSLIRSRSAPLRLLPG
jgi:hypothetical protein